MNKTLKLLLGSVFARVVVKIVTSNMPKKSKRRAQSIAAADKSKLARRDKSTDRAGRSGDRADNFFIFFSISAIFVSFAIWYIPV